MEGLEGLRMNRIEGVIIDSTPDGGYALRILRYYRARCNERVSDSSALTVKNPVLIIMNEAQEKRAKELDVAIQILEDLLPDNLEDVT
jgi:hypothetical protein